MENLRCLILVVSVVLFVSCEVDNAENVSSGGSDELQVKIFTLQSHSTEYKDTTNSMIDLDFESSRLEDVDIHLSLSIGSDVFVVVGPHNGTRMYSYGEELPSLEDCEQALPDGSERGMPEVYVGNHFCVRTSEGEIGSLLIKEINQVGSLPLIYDVIFEFSLLDSR